MNIIMENKDVLASFNKLLVGNLFTTTSFKSIYIKINGHSYMDIETGTCYLPEDLQLGVIQVQILEMKVKKL